MRYARFDITLGLYFVDYQICLGVSHHRHSHSLSLSLSLSLSSYLSISDYLSLVTSPPLCHYFSLSKCMYAIHTIVPTQPEKMRAELPNLNHCAVPFLSRAAVNLSWYNSTFSLMKLGAEGVKTILLKFLRSPLELHSIDQCRVKYIPTFIVISVSLRIPPLSPSLYFPLSLPPSNFISLSIPFFTLTICLSVVTPSLVSTVCSSYTALTIITWIFKWHALY